MSFLSLGLSKPLIRVLTEKGYEAPFSIQSKAIPAILAGKDVMGAAQTGTGKTAAFILPTLQRLTKGTRPKGNHVRVLVLTPTRELAVQVHENIVTYGRFLHLKSTVAFGGVKINPQMMKLRGGVDILVATPGRLLDLHCRNAIKLATVETLILDEADKMLNLGFRDDIQHILTQLPTRRQNLLFSATFSDEVRALTKGLLSNPILVEANPRNSTAKEIKQWVYEVDKNRKSALVCHLLKNNAWEQVLVFTRTKKDANRLVQKLTDNGISSAAIHGDKSQANRIQTLSEFKNKKIRILVATDIASRGLDIRKLSHVINCDLPKVAEDYIHRIGRTGRAGSTGTAISLVSADEVSLLSAIETLLRHTLVRELMTGFVPQHSVPLTRLQKPKAKKPKKPKKTRPATAHQQTEYGSPSKKRPHSWKNKKR